MTSDFKVYAAFKFLPSMCSLPVFFPAIFASSVYLCDKWKTLKTLNTAQKGNKNQSQTILGGRGGGTFLLNA
jgi:hypothetical protein